MSALLLLLSHSVYYESEDAAAVALAQVRAVLVGLKVADHKIAPSAVDIETQACVWAGRWGVWMRFPSHWGRENERMIFCKNHCIF